MIFTEGPVPNPPNNHRKQYPLCLVLAPTRELASQIYDESRKVGNESAGFRRFNFVFCFSFPIDR